MKFTKEIQSNGVPRSKSAGCLLILFFSGCVFAETATFTNPILPGGYPDPSICRSGEYYYLVNSTFEYFPGLPVHRSRDLVNWELIGHGLHREEQVTGAVNLVDVQSDGGIHAPTIRCRNGKFYIITTNVYLPPGKDSETEFVNFVVTADDPSGPWSMPRVLDGAPGIDPDLFFDDDGKVWYAGTHSPENPNFPGEGEIWLQEIDTKKWALIGKRHFLWRGACGGTWAEGPHLYKRDGRYYLMVAEGGTSFDHAVMVAVSDKITGPYHSNPRNPILTSRHLSYDNWVNSTGHGDLFELPDGRWYMVALGIRGDKDRGSNMGRETHLVPVNWEREPYWWKEPKYEWPVAAPATGRVERSLPLPFEFRSQRHNTDFTDNFDAGPLGPEWNFRRVPLPGTFSFSSRGWLRLYAKAGVIAERGRASLLGFRQTESDFAYEASMSFDPGADGAEAGISLFQKDDNYLNFTVRKSDGQMILALIVKEAKEEIYTIRSVKLGAFTGNILLRVESKHDRYSYMYSLNGGRNFFVFASTASNLILSKGYTGAYLGLYASGNGTDAGDYASFDWVKYAGYPK